MPSTTLSDGSRLISVVWSESVAKLSVFARPHVRKLREAGVDAWLDELEIEPGDDVVAAINRGLASYDKGLIFLSKEVEHGKWVQAEISTITLQAVEEGKPVIPSCLIRTRLCLRC